MNRVRTVGSNLAFIWNKNLIRLLIVLAVVTAMIAANGTVAFIESIVGLIGAAPAFALQLSFAATYIIFQFGILFWFLSRPRKYTVTPDDPQIGLSFENYRGQPDLLEHAKTTVGILRGVKEFELRGGEMPKGMLLSGAPGTGKTFLAACIAKEANLPFIYIDSSSLQGMFIGMTQLMIMKLFRDARGLARKYAEPGRRGACILFMDELDSIGQNRSTQSGGMAIGGFMGGGSMGLNTLLNQMDSLGELVEDRWRYKVLRWFGLIRGPATNKPLVFVIGATNRPEVLDQALVRPGRLDRMLVVHVPDADGRRDIIAHYLASKRHDPEIPMELLVTDSMGWTPVMIKTIINEALIQAHHDGREFLDYKDWLNAADERALGLKQPIRSWNLTDRRETAYHEAGHAVAARYLRPEHRISKASIIRRGPRAGLRPAATTRGADVAVRAIDRDADHDEPRRARRREPLPRHALDRAVERPALGDFGRGGLRRQPGDGPDQGHHPDATDRPTHRTRHHRGARAARPTLRGDRTAAPRQGTGGPSPGQGPDRARRAHRRRARGGLRRGGIGEPEAAREVRATGHPVPGLRADATGPAGSLDAAAAHPGRG